MSKWRQILFGGTVSVAPLPDDPYGRKIPPTHYSKHGPCLVGLGVLLGLLAPCIVLPSRFGFIAFDYTSAFIAASRTDQYKELLLVNTLVVLKYLGLELAGDLPQPPPGLIGTGAIVLLAVTDLAAAVAIGWGIKRIVGNHRQWLRMAKEE